jgi:hypothetical protein
MNQKQSKKIATQISKPRNIAELAKKIDGKYFGKSDEIIFPDLSLIVFYQNDKNHPDDEPRQAYFQGDRITAKVARNIELDLKGCSARWELRSGLVRARRPKQIWEPIAYDVILEAEIQRRIKRIPELAVLLRTMDQYL